MPLMTIHSIETPIATPYVSLCALSLPLLKSHTALCRFYFSLFGNDDLNWCFTLWYLVWWPVKLWTSIFFLYIAIFPFVSTLRSLLFTFFPGGKLLYIAVIFKSIYKYYDFHYHILKTALNCVTTRSIQAVVSKNPDSNTEPACTHQFDTYLGK